MAKDEPRRWRWMVSVALGCVVLGVLGTTWLASSRSEVHDLGTGNELLIINDAGPVRVRSLESYDGPAVDLEQGSLLARTSESWLLRSPSIEQLTTDDAAAFRVTCTGRLPCRASVEVFVPIGIELSIVAANDIVQVDSFRGAMSVFAGEGGVALGEVDGSVRIVSDGPVQGSNLGPSALSVNVVDDDVTLSYVDAPSLMSIVSGAGAIVIEVPSGNDYAVAVEATQADIGIESDPDADHLLSVQSEGPVSIQATDVTEDG